MLKFRLKYGAEVWVNSIDPNESAMIEFSGNQDWVEIIRDQLKRQYGAFGHLIGTSTTPIDLAAALRSPGMARFQPELIEGAELVERYDPKIPKDAVT
ncbi:hypothetical protein [Leptolyngbya sp. FACHB-711]|uniref:hypothetical protein n=1 Tax=Leptolyngbya sp. FACHB-711 TaxID=2692813 RepID=UPI001683333D|nr:hypothetical protein [Leptolyngbya sp. FACHB-711]MBD2025236.1 hypothetical protein [Leptolyngbya sp. FACHB-711]